MWAILIHASAEAMDVSKSLASLRHRPGHAKVRSTIQRRGRISKTLGLVGALDDFKCPFQFPRLHDKVVVHS